MFVVAPMQLRSSMNNKAPSSDRVRSPAVAADRLSPGGWTVGRPTMITNTDRMDRSGVEWGGDLQSTEQHQSLSRGSNGGVYQDDIYRESEDDRMNEEKEGAEAFVKFDREREQSMMIVMLDP